MIDWSSKHITEVDTSYYIIVIFLITAVVIGAASWSLTNGSTVTVSATVSQSVTCSTNVSTTAFGTLSSLAIATSTSDASSTMSCNDGLGCTLSINDAGNGVNGGLATTSPAYLIPSPASGFPATATLAAGTEGYGIMATTTATGSGGTLTIASRYLQTYTGNLVGGLSTSTLTLASSTSAISNREITVRHKAAISGTTQAASYVDTITYSCTGN